MAQERPIEKANQRGRRVLTEDAVERLFNYETPGEDTNSNLYVSLIDEFAIAQIIPN